MTLSQKEFPLPAGFTEWMAMSLQHLFKLPALKHSETISWKTAFKQWALILTKQKDKSYCCVCYFARFTVTIPIQQRITATTDPVMIGITNGRTVSPVPKVVNIAISKVKAKPTQYKGLHDNLHLQADLNDCASE